MPESPLMADRVGFERRPEGPVQPRLRSLVGYLRFLGLEARSTSDSRCRWARSAKTGPDPIRT